MKNSIVRRIIAPGPIVLLLLTLMLLTINNPASATLYTYTGPAFSSFSSPPIPSSTGIGDAVTMSFTYDGPLPLGVALTNGSSGVNLTMSSGGVSLSSEDLLSGLANLALFAVSATGLPTAWSATIDGTFANPAHNGWNFFTGFGLSFNNRDEVDYWPAGAGLSYAKTDGTMGVWTATPVPPTVFLLGSGLLGLAGWRRFRKV